MVEDGLCEFCGTSRRDVLVGIASWVIGGWGLASFGWVV